jgi:hypothetical protein
MGGATLAAAIAGTTGGAGAGVFDFNQGAGTVAIPSGYTQVSIEVWGACGGGGWSVELFSDFDTLTLIGGGGGSGGYSRSIITGLVAGDVGKTISYAVGTAGAPGTSGNPVGYSGGISSVSAGTFLLDEIVCTGGLGGTGPYAGGNQGAGGTASGGNTTNTNGNGGAAYTSEGAAGILGVNSLTGGNGGNAGIASPTGNDGQPGAPGRVRFVFS